MAHLVLSLESGGLERVVLSLVRARNRAAIDMRVLCLGAPGEISAQVEEDGVKVEALRSRRHPPVVQAVLLARHLRRLSLDVLHTHNLAAHLVGTLAAVLARVPVVVHTRHGPHTVDGPAGGRLARLLWRKSDAFVCVSQDAARIICEAERIPFDRVRVIYNGVDLQTFAPSDNEAPGFVGITVARLAPVKDQATMLRAVREVVVLHPDFRLTVVGDGPERRRLETLREELGLEASVTFLGERRDTPALLRSARVFLLSSLSEGVSLSLLEAMACALPVVATDVGGNREIVEHGTTGLLVSHSEPGALAAAVLALASQPALAKEMGSAARRRAEMLFDVRKMVATYEDLYFSGPGRHRGQLKRAGEPGVSA